jgi:hypothetical protein
MDKLYITIIIIVIAIILLLLLRQRIAAGLSYMHNIFVILFIIILSGTIFFYMYKDCIFCENGTCNFLTGTCTCKPGYFGTDCR